MLDDLTKEQKLMVLGLALLVFSGLIVTVFRRSFSSPAGEIVITETPGPKQAEPRPAGRVIVHVSGAVVEAGVYKLKFGDRVLAAVQAAGGESNLADLSKLNLAQVLKDGEQIIVPIKVRPEASQPAAQGGTRIVAPGQTGPVNINTADEKTLCEISGVGKTTAKKIIDYRTKNGLFVKIEDIMKVPSIGQGKFKKFKDEIVI
ncbi:competence protein ComEA [Candidatus Saganbacteria bacterium CG08_land_8_20_14_0_20_45_16]|uniref:Competence protein ComEA n=1 Tax=Candidatus Saganbacteria bacterium CG08_land_8_20_14_0_20_45_16 TaxID=2014293 RepID=A0A2H0XZL5_UNCSA|nr:MAG: competence protein ComEA [Candidatus Saganbacteria bacterium CG08_land_8_20_14_0_20_45_16]